MKHCNVTGPEMIHRHYINVYMPSQTFQLPFHLPCASRHLRLLLYLEENRTFPGIPAHPKHNKGKK